MGGGEELGVMISLSRGRGMETKITVRIQGMLKPQGGFVMVKAERPFVEK